MKELEDGSLESSPSSSKGDWADVNIRGSDFCAKVLTAGIHQGNKKFGDHAGTQCGSIIAVAAVVKKNKSIRNWKKDDVHNILNMGTEYHSKNKCRDNSNFVDLKDCSGMYEIDGKTYELTAKDYGVARASSDDSQSYLKPVQEILSEIIQNRLDVSIVYNNFTFGVFCEEKFVFFFNSHASPYLEDESRSNWASVLCLHSEIAADAIKSLLEATYSPQAKVDCNQRTIQFSSLSVTEQGTLCRNVNVLHLVSLRWGKCLHKFRIFVATEKSAGQGPAEQQQQSNNESSRKNSDASGAAENADLDDFQAPPENAKKSSRRKPVELDGNKWFKGPIGNTGVNKFKKLLRDFDPQFLQTKQITREQIQMNKVRDNNVNMLTNI